MIMIRSNRNNYYIQSILSSHFKLIILIPILTLIAMLNTTANTGTVTDSYYYYGLNSFLTFDIMLPSRSRGGPFKNSVSSALNFLLLLVPVLLLVLV